VSSINTASLASDTGRDFYMQLLIAQLQNQDPMEPLSNSDMITQMAQLSTVEAMDRMRASFSEMLKLQQLLGGTELLGRTVRYLSNGELSEGVVEAVSSREGSVRLLVNQAEVGLDSVQTIL